MNIGHEEEESAAFVVDIERFQGPLDLLLHLIREQDIDIFDIPIARITSQFLESVRGIGDRGLDNAGEFLEMAATLVRIKSRMLLPRAAEAEGTAEDPRFELVRRLLEYEHYREVARHLDEAEADRIRHFARGYVPPPPKPDPTSELDVDWDEVLDAILRLAERSGEEYQHVVRGREIPVQEKIDLILKTLARLARVDFAGLVEPFADRRHAVVTLLAGLELAHRRQVAIRQREPFAPLWLYRKNGEQEEDGDPADH